MALPELYEQIVWHNGTTPAINEDNLNAMSQALKDIDDRVIDIASTIMEDVPALEEALEEVETLTANPPYIGENGNWWVWDTSTGAYVDSGVDASITITIGTTTTLPAGSNATVTNTGTATDPIFNFGIPKGDPGESSGGGHTIENASGTDLTQRDILQFVSGFNTTDDSTHEKTVVAPDAMQSTDMADVITPLPSARSPYHKYSTTEQVVGEWIDGKPIYERTIIDTLPTVTTAGTFERKDIILSDIGINNVGIGFIVNAYIYTQINNGLEQSLPLCFPNNDFTNNITKDTKVWLTKGGGNDLKLSITCAQPAYSDFPVCVILRYTKTTD